MILGGRRTGAVVTCGLEGTPAVCVQAPWEGMSLIQTSHFYNYGLVESFPPSLYEKCLLK